MLPHNLRLQRLRIAVSILALLLAGRILTSIVLTYVDYFPADFNSGFLAGRQDHFHGLYQAAFYAHIVVGPIVLTFAYVLQFSGSKMRQLKVHRLLGKAQVLLVVLVITPSGIVMSTQANTGAFAGLGFATLSLVTGLAAIQTVTKIRRGDIAAHQVWANRCFLLLNSPLLLRLNSGVCYVVGIESDLTYAASAWLTWLLPLLAYACFRSHINDNVLNVPVFHFSSSTPR